MNLQGLVTAPEIHEILAKLMDSYDRAPARQHPRAHLPEDLEAVDERQ